MKSEKLNLYEKYKKDYQADRTPRLTKPKPARYLTIDGQGRPGGESFQAALGALYGMAYTIKMARKQKGRDYKVCGLEGLYWTGEPCQGIMAADPEKFRWKLMIRTPDFIAEKDMKDAVAKLLDKGKPELVKSVKLETIDEGKCVQVLHVGAYAKEAETVAGMQAFATTNGLQFSGCHHEIYLNDPRRVAESRLKTILRQPVAEKAQAQGTS